MKKYNVIYADPPWKYDDKATAGERGVDFKYKTMTPKQIRRLPVGTVCADDCVLFLWATMPQLELALSVMRAWGFTYKSSMVWIKDKIGMGYHARGRHEFILIGTKGTPGTPEPEDRPDSVIEAPRTEHSAKPDRLYELIEIAYPDKTYLEMFARRPRDKWEAWA